MKRVQVLRNLKSQQSRNGQQKPFLVDLPIDGGSISDSRPAADGQARWGLR